MQTEEANFLDVKTVEEYLETKGCILYGQHYNVRETARRRAAAEWLLAEIRNLYEFFEANNKLSPTDAGPETGEPL
jgi:hypothetical protein